MSSEDEYTAEKHVMIDKKERNVSMTRQTLVDIYHPIFRKGYQDGRQHYFQEQIIFTDKYLVECLQFVFEEAEREEAEKQEEGLYYSIGQLLGQVSGCVIPCQPHEDGKRDLQESLLVKVAQQYGAEGSTLLDAIRQFWEVQDKLAQKLDADTFEQIIAR
jgi:hypothetical protein